MEQLNINLFNLFILIGSLVGVLFSINLIIQNKKKSLMPRIVAGIFASMCLAPMQMVIRDLNFDVLFFDIPRIPTDILIVPLVFVMVEKYLENKLHKIIIIIPLIVFIVVLLFNICYQYKFIDISSDFYEKVGTLIHTIIPIPSIILITPVLFKIKIFIKKEESSHKLKLLWLKKMGIAASLLLFLWLITVIAIHLGILEDNFKSYYLLCCTIQVVVYWFAYTGIPIEVLESDNS